ncbi:MAG: hypothetical protein RIM80_14845 [Alphaproteobacteria bacterium]
MDRMYALFAPIAIMSLGGAFVIAALAFGAATWVAFVASAVAALVIGAPFSYWMTRRIKRKDPGYPPPAGRANP